MESQYSKDLSQVQSYFIDDKERLVLELKYDTGSMIFSPFSN